MMQSSILSKKATLRKVMRDVLKQITSDEKQRQSNAVVDHLLNKSEKFANSTHIAVYLAMKHEEIDTIPLIERVLGKLDRRQRIYVPHIEPKAPDMVFYELKSLEQYHNDMNTDNKFHIKQFNDVSKLEVATESIFDLIIVPGLAFDFDPKNQSDDRPITRMGRGKGYYDRFLRKTRPDCVTIGIGFDQQYLPLNNLVKSSPEEHLPVNEIYDVRLNEFICESVINKPT